MAEETEMTKMEIKEKINDNNTETIREEKTCKLLTFIKTKPIIFALIIIGTIGIVTAAIIVLLFLINKDKNNKDSNNENDNDKRNVDNLPEFDDIIPISNRKIVDFSEIKNSTTDVYNNITSKREQCPEINCFCSYLEDISTNKSNEEKVYLAYKWVAENIEYDLSGEPVECDNENVYKNNKTIYSGYARLFTKILQCLKFNNNIHNIQGHSKGLNYNVEENITDEDTNHEWNAVKLGNEWCLIDTTWGAGSILYNEFTKKYSEYHLCTPPEQFVRNHLPKESEKYLQALDNPIDLNTFKHLALTQPYFFEYGFIGLAYDKAIQNICGKGRIILKFVEQIPIPELAVLLKKENVLKNNWASYKKTNNNYFYIDFYINEPGNYDLTITTQTQTNEPIVSFKIKCDSSPEEEHTFPTFTTYYRNDDNVELIYPIYRYLEKGKEYNFKIWAPEINEANLLLKTSTGKFEDIPMEKEGEYFIKNYIMIYSGNVLIKLKQSDGFKNYVTYQSK